MPMCGIAGCFTAFLNSNHEGLIARIVRDQFHRGPDHQAIKKVTTSRGELILGHNRLSIIDLSDVANQPMCDVTQRFIIVYNGEIYNYLELRQELIALGHVFKTNSDTEVILEAFKAWNIAAVNRFNGPFSFALFDTVDSTLWLIRDRFGVKPLYYYVEKNTLYFASSIKTLANHFACKPNMNYVARGLQYLVYEDDTDISPYLKINQVPAAHYVMATLDQAQLKLKVIQYYALQTQVALLKEQFLSVSADQWLTILAEKLNAAVQVRLRADVAVGVSLSGGLDSSSVATLVNTHQSNVMGFTFGDPTVKSSEGPLAALLAKKIGLNVEYIWPSMTDIAQALPLVVDAQEAPFAGLSMIAQYLVYQKVKQTGIKVLLGGQGGDEGFMGYRKFQLFYLQQLLQQKKYKTAVSFFLQLLPLFISELSQLKLYWQQRKRYKNASPAESILMLSPINDFNLGHHNYPNITERQIRDITQFSLPTLLRYEDRNSMANSVESRLPFMDYQLLELGLVLPTTLKLHKSYGKWSLRQIMEHKIPEEIRMARYKRGFDVQNKFLLKAGLGNLLRTALNENYHNIKDFLLPGTDINRAFSDKLFAARSRAFAEAITLLWLGKCSL